MEEWLTPQWWIDLGGRVGTWFQQVVFTWPIAGQLAASVAAFGLAMLVARQLRRWLSPQVERPGTGRLVRIVLPLLLPLLWLILQWLALAVATAFALPSRLLDSLAGLLFAWVAIRLVSQLVRNPIWASLFVWSFWTIAALNIMGWLDPLVQYLRENDVPGGIDIKLFAVVQAILMLVVVLSAAVYLSSLVESRIKNSRTLSPSVQVLFVKSLRIVLISFALLMAIESLGISMTTLAVFGGVVGIGVGFGLQRVVANLISGVILLVDNSIKPGDVIAVSGTYGWVTGLGARYVSVVTRDGVEHLIPNEMLISERVENWTHTHSRTRLKVEVGVDYRTDIHRAMALCLEAAVATERVLHDPDPKCLLLEFGDSAIKLQVRFWIADAHNGVQNVKSEILLAIWEKFRAAGIEIPLPQRDLHLRSGFEALGRPT